MFSPNVSKLPDSQKHHDGFFLLSSLGCSNNAVCENQCGKAPECKLPLLIESYKAAEYNKSCPLSCFQSKLCNVDLFFSPVQFEVVCKYFFLVFFICSLSCATISVNNFVVCFSHVTKQYFQPCLDCAWLALYQRTLIESRCCCRRR